MKIALLGYGKMGKAIEALAPERGHEVVVTIDDEDDWMDKLDDLRDCDVAIEFSTPGTVVKNLTRCFEANIPVVCGTTGWTNVEKDILKQCQATSNALIYGSNFSIGANMFFKINDLMAQLMNQQPQYDVTIEETHHIHKKDAPSGTAIAIANIIINQLDRKKEWALEDDSDAADINIIAHRFGEEAGTHAVKYKSDDDCIILCHKAFNRAIFAQGAVRAARWLVKNRGIYPFYDIFLNI